MSPSKRDRLAREVTFDARSLMDSILETRTNVTKKKDRILMKDLISYKLKSPTKEARVILQSGIYIFVTFAYTLFYHIYMYIYI